MRALHSKHLAIYFLSSSALALSYPVFAAPAVSKTVPEGFTAEIRGAQRFTYDSNPLRLTTGEEEAFGSITSPELLLRWKTPTSQIISDSKIDANFFDESQYNSVDLHQKLLLSRNNQRWTAILRTTYDKETTRTAELTNYGLNLPKVKSTRIGAAPQIIFASTPRDRWILSSSASNVNYSTNAYTDYNFYSLAPSYEHKFDAENTGSIGINAQRYETTNDTLTSDSVGPTIGWTTQINPRLTLRTTAGTLYTKSDSSTGADNNTWNYVFSGNLAYTGNQDRLTFSATRARQPFGNGTETLLDTFAFTERHQLNQTLALNASGKYQSADYSSTPGVNLDEGYSAGAGVSYALTERTELNADYNYRHENLTSVANPIKQHVVMIGITYKPSLMNE